MDVAERRKSNVKGKGCFKNKKRKRGRKETEGNKRGKKNVDMGHPSSRPRKRPHRWMVTRPKSKNDKMTK